MRNERMEEKTIAKDLNANKSCSNEIKNELITEKSFSYRSCWQNDERMQVLFSPFRPRDVNPENYDSKMRFWQDAIAQYCTYHGNAIFSIRVLQATYLRKQVVPLCLQAVVEGMLVGKTIRRRTEYEYDPENSWTGWAVNSFIKRPTRWCVFKLKSSIGLMHTDMVEYVHLEIINKFCKDLELKVLNERRGQVLLYEHFKNIVTENMELADDCLNLCLRTFHCQRKIGLTYKEITLEVHLIKIPAKTGDSIIITEAENAVHNLQCTQGNLLQQLEELENNIKINEDKARQYLKENKRQLAKTYLRKKKLLEQNHEKRSQALHNIETLLSNVDEAQNNGEILDAYKFGSKALQNALKESGLKYDNVDEIVSEMSNVMATHREIQETLSTSSAAIAYDDNSIHDNDELELELKALMKETDDLKNPVHTTASTEDTVQRQTSKTVVISDEELLAMLKGLEVQNMSPKKNETALTS